MNETPNVSDLGLSDCESADGLLLHQETSDWGLLTSIAATHISRGKLTPKDVEPPSDLLARY